MNTEIYIGRDIRNPLFTFNRDEDIVSGSISLTTSIDVIGEELSADQFEAEVVYTDTDGTLRGLGWATPVHYYDSGKLIGKFYSTGVVRTGKDRYKLSATSAYGILEYKTHYGGMFSGDRFADVVKDILCTDGIAKFRKGYYTKLHRGVGAEESTQFKSLWVDSNYGPNGSTRFFPYNFNCRLSAKFTLNRFIPDTFTSETSVRVYLLGASPNTAATEYYQKLCYGMYMDVSRASVNDDWPEFGEVFFRYSGSLHSLGTPTGPTTYTVNVDPSRGTATINGRNYSISFTGADASYYVPLNSYGGGIRIGANGSTAADILCCDALYEYVRVYSDAGYLISDIVTVKDFYTEGRLKVIDQCTTRYSSSPHIDDPDYTAVSEDDYSESPNPTAYPLFAAYPMVELDSFTEDLMESLAYGEDIDNIPVYGWIDITTKREALHQLLFASGVILKKDENGSLLFTYPTNSVAGEIPAERIYDEGSEEQFGHTNVIELTEHSYYYDSSVEAEEIYNNQDAPASGGYYAEFSSRPAATRSSPDSIRVLEDNCNAAVIYGSGTMTGKLYVHGEATVSKAVADYPDGSTLTISDATLVTMLNSAAVMDKLAAYYGKGRKIKNSVIHEDETCGLNYDFINPFNEEETGFLVAMTQTPSGIMRSECDFVCGYKVPAAGNVDYTNFVLLTGSGTWTVPEEVFEKDVPRIRVVIIGGGAGGESGFAGADGQSTKGTSTAAEGGLAGNFGTGGNVYDVVIDNPAAAYDYVCGVGGEGGAINTSKETNNPGSLGTDSTFTDGVSSWSSESGFPVEGGYRNFFTGKFLAAQNIPNDWNSEDDFGIIVISYFRGGNGGCITYNHSEGYAHYNAPGACYFTIDGNQKVSAGGSTGNDYSVDGGFYTTGGMGGGGAAGGAGGKGGNGGKSKSGSGGKGADATAIPAKEVNGNGGWGGFGGGGGGSSGVVSQYVSGSAGAGGAGGYGGKGGDGGDGCILIYY